MCLSILSIIIVLFTKSKSELDAMKKTETLKAQSIAGTNKEKNVWSKNKWNYQLLFKELKKQKGLKILNIFICLFCSQPR